MDLSKRSFNNIVESNILWKLFNLSDNAISALKKACVVHQIIILKGKVTVDSDLQNLCDQISNSTRLAMASQQINSELAVIKVVNSKLDKSLIDLEKTTPSRSNIVEGTLWNLVTYPIIYQIIN